MYTSEAASVLFSNFTFLCKFFGWACMAVAANLDLRLVVYVV